MGGSKLEIRKERRRRGYTVVGSILGIRYERRRRG
jgi:hypothetical protein